GSQQDGIAFVTVVDDFKEQVGGVRVIGQVANLVNTEKGGTGVEAELAAAQAWGIAIEIGEQVAGGAEQDGVAGEHGGVGDILGDHGLAQSVGAAQDEVAALAEEVQGEGAFDQGAVDFLGPVPFEVSHGFEAAETGLSEAAFEAAAGEIGGLGAGDFFQQLVGAPALGGRPGQEIIQALGGDEQAQIFQLRGQVIL